MKKTVIIALLALMVSTTALAAENKAPTEKELLAAVQAWQQKLVALTERIELYQYRRDEAARRYDAAVAALKEFYARQAVKAQEIEQ